MDNRRTRKHRCGLFRRIAPLAVAFGLSGVWTGQALAAVKTYTGCLNLARGYFTKVAEGAAPASACTLGQTQVTLSGGDITDVATPAAGPVPAHGRGDWR